MRNMPTATVSKQSMINKLMCNRLPYLWNTLNELQRLTQLENIWIWYMVMNSPNDMHTAAEAVRYYFNMDLNRVEFMESLFIELAVIWHKRAPVSCCVDGHTNCFHWTLQRLFWELSPTFPLTSWHSRDTGAHLLKLDIIWIAMVTEHRILSWPHLNDNCG